jgi:hypothetical protein
MSTGQSKNIFLKQLVYSTGTNVFLTLTIVKLKNKLSLIVVDKMVIMMKYFNLGKTNCETEEPSQGKLCLPKCMLMYTANNSELAHASTAR